MVYSYRTQKRKTVKLKKVTSQKIKSPGFWRRRLHELTKRSGRLKNKEKQLKSKELELKSKEMLARRMYYLTRKNYSKIHQ